MFIYTRKNKGIPYNRGVPLCGRLTLILIPVLKIPEESGKTRIVLNSKKRYSGTIAIPRELWDASIRFAVKITCGEGATKDHRSGGDYHRTPFDMFINHLSGKLCECCVYNYFKTHNYMITKPDFSISGEGIWDSGDFQVLSRTSAGNARIAVKSTKSYGNVLLLEKADWNSYACYKHDADPDNPLYRAIDNSMNPHLYDTKTKKLAGFYDYFIFVRFGNEITEKYLPVQMRNIYNAQAEEENIKMVTTLLFPHFNDKLFELTGWMSWEDLRNAIRYRHIINKGEMLGKTVVDADNYYIQAGVLNPFEGKDGSSF